MGHSATTIKEPPEPFLRNFGIDRTDLSTNQRTAIARFSAKSYFFLNLVYLTSPKLHQIAGRARVRPRWGPDEARVRPGWGPGKAQVRLGWGPREARVRPGWGPGEARVRPGWGSGEVPMRPAIQFWQSENCWPLIGRALSCQSHEKVQVI